MKNEEIAAAFSSLADILEIRGADRFRVNAYRRASRIVESLGADVADLVESDELREIPGIGDGTASLMEEYLETGRMSVLESERKVVLVLWGVGDHGGGPSRKDVKDVNRMIARRKDCRVMHSTPEGYFKGLRRYRGELQRHAQDINPWAVGCYTSMVQVKRSWQSS